MAALAAAGRPGDMMAKFLGGVGMPQEAVDGFRQSPAWAAYEAVGLTLEHDYRVMAEASATLKEFRKAAETLNSRLGTITDGLARFSGQGLRDVESLVRDSRRSVNRIEEAITDLERNPQRIITGGDGAVRQYDGRARR